MNLTRIIAIGKLSILILFSVCLTHCNNKKETHQWSDAHIDAQISKDLIYQQLNAQEEIRSPMEKRDSFMKRTSDVAYFKGEKIDFKDDKYSKFNNCRAYFHSDTLAINIGIGNGFAGQGFLINYKNEKFYTEPYYYTDVITGEADPTYKIVYQKLTLDKSGYKAGDSLYGKIEFKSLETDHDGTKIEHFGKGNFRAKVKMR